MNREHTGGWVRLPWGTFRLPPAVSWLQAAVVLTSLLLMGLGVGWFLTAPRQLSDDVALEQNVDATGARLPVPEGEPLSVLFGLDKRHPTTFVLLSTVVGPHPRAVVKVDGESFQVSPGDTVQGAVVDSVGRGMILMRLNGRAFRVTL